MVIYYHYYDNKNFADTLLFKAWSLWLSTIASLNYPLSSLLSWCKRWQQNSSSKSQGRIHHSHGKCSFHSKIKICWWIEFLLFSRQSVLNFKLHLLVFKWIHLTVIYHYVASAHFNFARQPFFGFVISPEAQKQAFSLYKSFPSILQHSCLSCLSI